MPPITARIVLAGLAVLLIAGSTTPAPKLKSMANDQGDVALFETVIRRIRSGETYYPAMGDELRKRGYPTASVFNWRMPFPLSAAATAPRATAFSFLAVGLLMAAGTLVIVLKEPPGVMLPAVFAQIGVTVSLLKVPQFVLLGEAWCGFLIAASVVAYGRSRWLTGASFGILALLARELAAPYCVACGLLALAERRWREVAVWSGGLILYIAYFFLHVCNVTSQLGTTELAHEDSWVQFGGLPFLLRVVGFVGWYDVLPAWSRAVGCVLLVASLWAAGTSRQVRALVVAYLLFFSAIGQSFNQYWGLVTAPAFAIAIGYGVAGLLRLIAAARPIPSPSLRG